MVSRRKRNGKVQFADSHLLRNARAQMHLDARLPFVEACFMRELRDIEIAIEFAIDAREQIEIERRRNADRIVIGADKPCAGFHKVRAEQQAIAGLEAFRTFRKKIAGLVPVEITDRTAEKKYQNALPVLPRPASAISMPSR